MSSFAKVTTGALVVVPGPEQTITFVRQERGPYAGSWLLPGGKLEFGESLEDTARREALEETGCVVGSMSGIGLYEMRGQWARGPYHFMMYVFLANQSALVPDGFAGHHVTTIQQMRPSQVHPHPTELAHDGIVMTRYLARTLTSDFGVLIGSR